VNFFARQAVTFKNEQARSCAALLGIAQGLLADGVVNQAEAQFLRKWLLENSAVGAAWPGNVILSKIEHALADGRVDDPERLHLQETLQRLVGGTLDELAESAHVSSLAIDQIEMVDFEARRFCLTGDFVFGPRSSCAQAIELRRGLVENGVTKKLHYLVVGGLGSAEWKHGSFGTKVEKAMQYKQTGAPLLVVHEDAWAAGLSACSPRT
jgi:NAD-dependent DNA ligase